MVWAASGFAQQPAPDPGQAEAVTRDEPATFRVRTNLVLAPVVVRDRQGRAAGNLQREDFQLFDRGKAQVITKFSVETRAAKPTAGPAAAAKRAGDLTSDTTPDAVPERFIAYVFDDIHLEFADLARSRDAAGRLLDTLESSARAGIFTTSGRTALDFTDDRPKLRETLSHLRLSGASNATVECPDVSHYLADMILNKDDKQALAIAIDEALACLGLDPGVPGAVAFATDAAKGAANRALAAGDAESRLALGCLRNVVRRMAVLPGQRAVIVVSPGFLTPNDYSSLGEVIDRAIQSNVRISALDARGLYVVEPGGSTAKRVLSTDALMMVRKANYDSASASMQADALGSLADGTGGDFFHNSNDLDRGFNLLAAPPEYRYLLGFSPEGLKSDGSFHALKITVKGLRGASIRARRGYYAPKIETDPAQTAKQEIEDALFSREEIHDIPVELKTQFFKVSETAAKLSIVARMDVKHLKYRKIDGRNRNSLTIVTALFDRQGNYVEAVQKLVEMRLRDTTIEAGQGPQIAVKTSFDLKPGTYLVRLVVRDAEGQAMAAQSSVADIPY